MAEGVRERGPHPPPTPHTHALHTRSQARSTTINIYNSPKSSVAVNEKREKSEENAKRRPRDAHACRAAQALCTQVSSRSINERRK